MRTDTREVTTTKTMYIAEDGIEFDNPWNCQMHEEELRWTRMEKAAERLRFDANTFDWPSLADPTGPDHEYKWFKVCSNEDLKLFCDSYTPYCRDLKDVEYVKEYIRYGYPDYICLVDYPHGESDNKWNTLSKLLEQSDVFLSQITELGNARHETIELIGDERAKIEVVKWLDEKISEMEKVEDKSSDAYSDIMTYLNYFKNTVKSISKVNEETKNAEND